MDETNSKAKIDIHRKRIKRHIGKPIRIKSDPVYATRRAGRKREKYVGIIEAAYKNFFIVKRKNGAKTTYQYTDMYIADHSKQYDFELINT